MQQFLQQLSNGITLGSLYALIALGYTMVYGIIQLINFAHGEVFMIGAFGSLFTWTLFFNGNTSLWVLPFMLLGAMVASITVAIIMERFAYRPLRHAPRLAPLITAIGVSVFLQEAVRLFYPVGVGTGSVVFGAKAQQGYPSIDFVTGSSIAIGGVNIKRTSVFIVVVAAACMIALITFVRRSRTGRAMQATAQDPDTAKLMGINTDRIIVIAFILGAVLAAVAGVAQGLYITNIDFRMGFLAGLKAFTAAVLGGIGNIGGAVLGGLALGVIEAMATNYVPGQFGGGAWKDVWAFIILILVLVFRPQGLLGERVADRA